MTSFFVYKGDDRLLFDSPIAFKTFVQTKKKGWRGILSIGKFTERRTDPQNKFYWAVVIPAFADKMGYDPRDKTEMAFVNGQIQIACGRFEERKTVNGKTVQYPKGTSNMMKDEFSEYLERVFRLAAENEIYVPDPNSAEATTKIKDLEFAG